MLLQTLMQSQVTFLLENNTQMDFERAAAPSLNNPTMLDNDWTTYNQTLFAWQNNARIFRIKTDNLELGIYQFNADVIHGMDTLKLKARIAQDSIEQQIDYKVYANQTSQNWYSITNNTFHQFEWNVGGNELQIKFTGEISPDGTIHRVRIAIHDFTPFLLPSPEELNDKNMLNLLSYNIALLTPFGIIDHDETTRVNYIKDVIPDYLDVIVFEEAFELEQTLIESLEDRYPYVATNLNEANVVLPGLTKNGGVLIMSKWPIIEEDDIDFQSLGIPCGIITFDCLARKGVKYVQIDKMGRPYHIFGTHLDAAVGNNIHLAQLEAFNDFILAKDIPDNEAVLMAGDFNISFFTSLYNSLRSIISIAEPTYLGQPYIYSSSNYNHYSIGSNSSLDEPSGSFIDFTLSSSRHLLPLSSTEEIWFLRSIHDDMWKIFDLSDHQAVLGRFQFPSLEITIDSEETCVTASETFDLLASTNTSASTFEWFKNDVLIDDQLGPVLSNLELPDTGRYHILLPVNYAPDSMINSSYHSAYIYPGNYASIQKSNVILVKECNSISTGISASTNFNISIYPNPVMETLHISLNKIGNQDEISYQLQNVFGQILCEDILISHSVSIDVKDFPNGIYYLNLTELTTNKSSSSSFLKF